MENNAAQSPTSMDDMQSAENGAGAINVFEPPVEGEQHQGTLLCEASKLASEHLVTKEVTFTPPPPPPSTPILKNEISKRQVGNALHAKMNRHIDDFITANDDSKLSDDNEKWEDPCGPPPPPPLPKHGPIIARVSSEKEHTSLEDGLKAAISKLKSANEHNPNNQVCTCTYFYIFKSIYISVVWSNNDRYNQNLLLNDIQYQTEEIEQNV